MTELTSTAAATIAVSTLAVPAITAFGIPLGLRPDLLVAGFSGSIVAITLLNSVPCSGDTWRELVRSTLRRMAVAVASSLTAGYLAPMVLLLASVPDALMLGGAFATGAGAQRVLASVISKISGSNAVESAR